jgi:hypothetical protein
MIKKLWCIMAFIFIAIPLFSQQVVELEEVLRFSDAPEKEIFFRRPLAIKLDDDGNIYIRDRPHILKFGPDGKFLVKMIKKGQGPGELPDGNFGSLVDFIIAKNKVIAFSSYKALWFNEKGEFQEEKRFPINGFWANFIVTPDLNYYAFERIKPRRDVLQKVGSYKYPVYLWRISPDFKEKKLIYKWELSGKVREDGSYSLRAPRYFLIDSEILIINMTDEYGFFSFDLKKSKIVKTFTRKYKRIKNQRLTLYFQRGTIYHFDISSFHYVWPELWVVTSTKDENKNLLIHSYDLKSGDMEEFYLKLPKSEDDIFRGVGSRIAIVSGFIFSIEQNSEGLYNIVKYRIKRAKVSRAAAALKVDSLLLVQNLKTNHKLY